MKIVFMEKTTHTHTPSHPHKHSYTPQAHITVNGSTCILFFQTRSLFPTRRICSLCAFFFASYCTKRILWHLFFEHTTGWIIFALLRNLFASVCLAYVCLCVCALIYLWWLCMAIQIHTHTCTRTPCSILNTTLPK